MCHSFLCGYVFTAAILMGHCVLQTISASSTQTGGSLPDDFIGFSSTPDKVANGSVVRVQYCCSRPCQLAVEVVVSTLRKTDLVVFRRKWISNTPRVHRIHQVTLRLPPSILYQRDFFNRRVLAAQNGTVRAWLDHLNDAREHSTYHGSTLRVYKALQIEPLSARPTKPPTACPSWSAQLMWQITRDRIHQCPHESDVIDMLKFPLASPGEYFGVVRRFPPFIDRALERARLHAVTHPSVTLSVWIYLLKWCHKKLCGIIHHVDRKNAYDSVLLQLTDTGDVIIQARVTTGEDEAFRARAVLPRWKWIRLDCYIQDSKCLISFWNSCKILKDGSFPAGKLQAIAVLLDSTWDGKTHRFGFRFRNSVHYDDTDGYFVIGGSKYMPGIHGYFGPIKYYRLGTNEVKNDPESTLQELDETHKKCEDVQVFTQAFLQAVTESRDMLTIKTGVCNTHFIRLWDQYRRKNCTQTWTWETQLQYSTLFNFLQSKEEEIRTEGSLGLKHLRSAFFKQAVDTVFPLDAEQHKITFKSAALLQAASCFGNHEASLLLAAIHLSSLGRSVSQQQGSVDSGPNLFFVYRVKSPHMHLPKGHVYSLIGASGNNRFALMHAGYKHSQGIDGFPKDLDMAYSYYSTAGSQSTIDRSRIHEKKQYTLEHIYLSNREDLKRLTHETNDAFQYLKYQAESGDVDSQKRMASLLYWGQQGVSKDIETAVKWFERIAMRAEDPSAMYDYSILLMKGRGVKRNYTRGYKLLKKAAEMGSVNALNGLGWYHGSILKDHKNAMKYFEQAALNGSGDGMFNLGIYHLIGKNPDSLGRNETAAFLLFLNASGLGHVGASVEAAWYLSTGSLEGVSQDVERAVIMLKKVCEQNGHLGFMIRDALQAYLQGSRRRAFVKYVLAAETGLGLAQSNVAHLCEMAIFGLFFDSYSNTGCSVALFNSGKELNLGDDCQWRYHNHSILNYDPHPSALLRMGDHYYSSSSSREDSLSLVGQAISMYGRAALAGSPQGMYNLVLLAQQGHILPLSIRGLFNVSHCDEQDIVEKILERCVESEEEEAVTPCSLGLLRVQMGKALRRMTQNSAQLLLAYASLLSVAVITVILPLQSCLEQSGVVSTMRAGTSSVSQDGVNLNREQNGITMGGTYGARGNLWLSVLNGQQWLWQTCDLAVTLSGVCLCAFWTTLLYHLL